MKKRYEVPGERGEDNLLAVRFQVAAPQAFPSETGANLSEVGQAEGVAFFQPPPHSSVWLELNQPWDNSDPAVGVRQEKYHGVVHRSRSVIQELFWISAAAAKAALAAAEQRVQARAARAAAEKAAILERGERRLAAAAALRPAAKQEVRAKLALAEADLARLPEDNSFEREELSSAIAYLQAVLAGHIEYRYQGYSIII